MRQIKFRRPMYKNGKFDRFEYWGFGLENHLFDGPPFDSLDNPLKTAHESVEQFTGLLDKDGKEIYEGDIVVLKKQKRNNLVAVKLEVYWNMNRMYWGLNPIRRPEWRNRSSDVANLTYCTRCEVIGNIHEEQK